MTELEYAILEAEDTQSISPYVKDTLLSVLYEKKAVSDYRKDKFLKSHDYDPKTKTILMDGKRVNFNYTGGGYKRPGKIDMSTNARLNTITTGRAVFNQRHPKTHEFIMSHERGHIAEYDNIPKSLRNLYEKIMELIEKPDSDIGALNAAYKRFLREKDKYEKDSIRVNPELAKMDKKINAVIKKYEKHMNSHGTSPEEYRADAYAVSHGKMTKQDGIRALKDTERMTKADGKKSLQKETRSKLAERSVTGKNSIYRKRYIELQKEYKDAVIKYKEALKTNDPKKIKDAKETMNMLADDARDEREAYNDLRKMENSRKRDIKTNREITKEFNRTSATEIKARKEAIKEAVEEKAYYGEITTNEKEYLLNYLRMTKDWSNII